MHKLRKGLRILYWRLREQGLRVTALWAKDHALRLLTGMSPPATSRISPGLYVGGQQYRRGLGRLARLGISASLSMRREADDAAPGVALEKHLWLPTTDDAPPSLEQLGQTTSFIGDALSEGRGVYVHCLSGVGRAATAAAAYLVSTGLTPDEAWAAIRRVRPFVRPSEAQTAVLVEFYRRSPVSDERAQ
ncbi:MAG: dual specificity protein phosphatase family protein [Anaerolineae bacterium]|nr:dual specificity protein phosphatase family protein [Anaerolineae bacterium]